MNSHKYSSYILPKYYPCHWAPTNISYIKSHKLPWGLSKILPIISHILSNLDFPRKILTMLLPKLSHKIMLSPQKNTQNHSTYGQSPKAQQNLHTKPATMQHLQSPLQCGISKTRYDLAIFLQNPTKPKCQFGTYFIKPKHYYLAPILQSPNINLAHIFIKAKY